MKIVLAAFTAHGVELEKQIAESFLLDPPVFGSAEPEKQKPELDLYAVAKYCGADDQVQPILPSLSAWTGARFPACDAMIFISATGICVRAIAPYVKSKKEDPAVICMDEQAKFCISLLSGHIGGANELCERIAADTGAIPVITTATDRNGLWAVDVSAVKNHFAIGEMKLAKEVAAALISGKKVGISFAKEPREIFSGFDGKLPVGLVEVPDYKIASEAEGASDGKISSESGQVSGGKILSESKTAHDNEKLQDLSQFPLGIRVSLSDSECPFEHTLHLIPKWIHVGVGCKKDTPAEQIEETLLSVLADYQISLSAVQGIYSIDLKAEEPGIHALCEKYHWPFVTFSAEELKSAPGDFTPSGFVKSVTGVDNVCERSAVCSGGSLLVRKTKGKGVTIALAIEHRRIKL